jgi:hypothetical protein
MSTLTDSAIPDDQTRPVLSVLAGQDLTLIISIHFNIQSKVEKHTAWNVVFKQLAQVWIDTHPRLFIPLGRLKTS